MNDEQIKSNISNAIDRLCEDFKATFFPEPVMEFFELIKKTNPDLYNKLYCDYCNGICAGVQDVDGFKLEVGGAIDKTQCNNR